jgi:hypothetical protein
MRDDPTGGDMDRSEVRELTLKLLQAKVDGDTAMQDAARAELARAMAEQAPGLKSRIRVMQATAMANIGNDNA